MSMCAKRLQLSHCRYGLLISSLNCAYALLKSELGLEGTQINCSLWDNFHLAQPQENFKGKGIHISNRLAHDLMAMQRTKSEGFPTWNIGQ